MARVEIITGIDGMASRHAVDGVGEVRFRIEAAQLGALQYGVEDRGAFGSALLGRNSGSAKKS